MKPLLRGRLFLRQGRPTQKPHPSGFSTTVAILGAFWPALPPQAGYQALEVPQGNFHHSGGCTWAASARHAEGKQKQAAFCFGELPILRRSEPPMAGVRLSYLSQASGRAHKPNPQARIRAIGQTGPSGGSAAFRDSPA